MRSIQPKFEKELSWKPEHSFKEGLEDTVNWYMQNAKWLERITSGEYKNYYNTQYDSN